MVCLMFSSVRRLRFAVSILTSTLFLIATVAAEDVPRLTIATKRFGGVQLMTVGINGSNAVQLTNDADDATQPTWCPDGTKLCYISGPRTKGRLKIMDADGNNVHLLFNGEGSAHRSGLPMASRLLSRWWSTAELILIFLSSIPTARD